MKRKRIIYVFWQMLGILLMSLSLPACRSESSVYLEEYVAETTTGADEQEIADISAVQNAGGVVDATEQALCYVYVCGAVVKPGVYALPEGSRIFEAIVLAGGLLEDADTTAVNQAEVISDGQMIRIYTCDEMADAVFSENAGSQTTTVEDGRVNINTASRSELMTLPGIGSAKADAIVAYRESNGAFSDIEELKNIPGIKEGIFEQLKEHIKIN